MRKEAQCLVTGLNGAQISSVAVGREDLEDLRRTPTPFKKKEELLKAEIATTSGLEMILGDLPNWH